ncbi:MAG: glycosyltransferase [Anaerolineae bacterium]|nr:glycosyltransferase [Anaerolineae bacterium]
MTTSWFQHQIGIVVFLGVLLLIALSNLWALRRLGDYPAPSHAPRVSVLIPARNEMEAIGPCLRSLLTQDYPDFEVLVLDDGSTDGTGAVLAKMEAQDERLRVLQGRSLPEGWLGKHWACWQLAEAAPGDLLLFTDADTHHSPGTLQAAMAAVEAEGADLLTGFVYQEVVSWGERLTIPVAFWCFFSFLPLGLAHRVRLPALSLTNGQMMLFRRQAYQTIGGHQAVRNNPVDDIALGQRVKAIGLRWRAVDAGEFISCRMYRSLQEALEGFSKNLFAVFDFRLLEYLFVWLWITLITWEPLAVLALKVIGVPLPQFARWPAALAVAEMLALWLITLHRLRFPRYLAFFYPISTLLFLSIAFRSLVWTATGWAAWKGRPLPRQRVRLI